MTPLGLVQVAYPDSDADADDDMEAPVPSAMFLLLEDDLATAGCMAHRTSSLKAKDAAGSKKQ